MKVKCQTLTLCEFSSKINILLKNHVGSRFVLYITQEKKNCLTFSLSASRGQRVIGAPLSPTSNDCSEKVKELSGPTHPTRRKTTPHTCTLTSTDYLSSYTQNHTLPTPYRTAPAPLHLSEDDMASTQTCSGKTDQRKGGEKGGGGRNTLP